MTPEQRTARIAELEKIKEAYHNIRDELNMLIQDGWYAQQEEKNTAERPPRGKYPIYDHMRDNWERATGNNPPGESHVIPVPPPDRLIDPEDDGTVTFDPLTMVEMLQSKAGRAMIESFDRMDEVCSKAVRRNTIRLLGMTP